MSETVVVTEAKKRGPSARRSRSGRFTRSEVAAHNAPGDLWLIIDDGVYDISKWYAYHPGGPKPLLGLAGKDASVVFAAFHPQAAADKLKAFRIGEVVDPPATTMGAEYKELEARMRKDGLFEPKPSSTIKSFALSLVFLVASLACVFGTDADFFAAKMAGAVMLGIFWQQLAFVGHDTGHNSVWWSRDQNYRFGIMVLEPLLGLSVGWWKDSHNTHHVVTNSITHDCDIQHLPFLSVSKELFSGFFSTYHERKMDFDTPARWLVSIQHILFYPIMFFGRFNLYAQSIIFLLLKNRAQHRNLEIACLSIFALWNALLLASFQDTTTAVCFFFLSHGVSGLLHVQICLSHFTMETYHDFDGHENDSDNFVRTQLATSMDVLCPSWMNWFHGGLQFQVEHHLFPRLPRCNLPASREYILPFLKKHDIPFVAHDFIKANALLVEHMRRVAMEARKASSSVPLEDAAIFAGLALRG